jgi:hypothetical protein
LGCYTSYGLRLIYREVVDVCVLLTEQTGPSSSGSHAPCPPPPWLRHHLPNHLRLRLDRGAVGSRPSPPLLPSPATTQGPKRLWLPTTALGRLMHYLHTTRTPRIMVTLIGLPLLAGRFKWIRTGSLLLELPRRYYGMQSASDQSVKLYLISILICGTYGI